MKRPPIFLCLSVLIMTSFVFASSQAAMVDEFKILAWNVESDGADPAVIAEQLKELDGYQIYALSEVNKKDFGSFHKALGEEFKSINGTHKENDHLQLIYNAKQLELLRWSEMEEHGGIKFNYENRALRCPLFAHFRDLKTKEEFQVVSNHLARGNAKFRTQQAIGLREWARLQTIPTIAIGDFNFDYEFKTRRGNEGFKEFTRDNVWKWIEPKKLIDTNWYDREKDGEDDYPGSMLDFAFVAGPAKGQSWSCHVIVRPGDFPDDGKTSDHRPIVLSR